jgi:hypothetical protein
VNAPEGQSTHLPCRCAQGSDRCEPRPLPDRQGLAGQQRQVARESVRRGLGGDRKPGKDGKLPAVGNTVDVKEATWTNTIGATELIAVWKDPDFSPEQKAFYYGRVIEIPTPRWTAYDAKYFGLELPDEVPMTTQERAYTSPIWYTP